MWRSCQRYYRTGNCSGWRRGNVMATRALREHADQTEARASLRMWLRLLRCTNLIESQIRGLLRERFRTTLPRFDVLAQLDAANLELGRGLTLSELCRRL